MFKKPYFSIIMGVLCLNTTLMASDTNNAMQVEERTSPNQTQSTQSSTNSAKDTQILDNAANKEVTTTLTEEVERTQVVAEQKNVQTNTQEMDQEVAQEVQANQEQATSSQTAMLTKEATSTETANTEDAQNTLILDASRLSATFGYRIAKNLIGNSEFEFDLESFISGMRSASAGDPPPMTEEDFMKALSTLQEKAYHELAQSNLEEANKFMQDNASKETIVEIEPGRLQYEIVNMGNGSSVTKENSPLVHYTGKYLDGTVFASSVETGTPVNLSKDQWVPFKQGVIGAKEGETRRIFIHPDLGNGTKGFHPPNSLLVFDVEIVKVESSTATKETAEETETSTSTR